MTRPAGIAPSNAAAIQIAPHPALLDQPVSVRIQGLAPGSEITVRAQTVDHQGRLWSSQARFRAHASGMVDLTGDAPLSGSYAGRDPMGLFWSMSPPAENRAPFVLSDTRPLRVELTAEQDGAPLAAATLERRLVAPHVHVTPVDQQGLYGRFFDPGAAETRPGVLVLGGSVGGLHWSQHIAALLASHGIPALALAYFAAPGLPQRLVQIPLEYFEAAIGWLQDRPGVARPAVGVVGHSRGAELALLLSTRLPAIRALVAVAPSSVIVSASSTSMPNQPAWTHRGEPLPFLDDLVDPAERARYFDIEPLALTPYFLQRLETSPTRAAATLPVERSRAAMLLVSGQDDQLWPAALMARQIVDRLDQHGYAYPYQQLSYPGAGHALGLPHLPTTVRDVLHPILSRTMSVSGEPQLHAHALAEIWPRVTDFLVSRL